MVTDYNMKSLSPNADEFYPNWFNNYNRPQNVPIQPYQNYQYQSIQPINYIRSDSIHLPTNYLIQPNQYTQFIPLQQPQPPPPAPPPTHQIPPQPNMNAFNFNEYQMQNLTTNTRHYPIIPIQQNYPQTPFNFNYNPNNNQNNRYFINSNRNRTQTYQNTNLNSNSIDKNQYNTKNNNKSTNNINEKVKYSQEKSDKNRKKYSQQSVNKPENESNNMPKLNANNSQIKVEDANNLQTSIIFTSTINTTTQTMTTTQTLATPNTTNKIKLDTKMNIIKNETTKTATFKFNENEFPSLDMASNKQNEVKTMNDFKPLNLFSNENKEKLIKNVNFLKTQIEKHYAFENNLEDFSKDKRLSFKEALEKPLDTKKINETIIKPTKKNENLEIKKNNKSNIDSNLNINNRVKRRTKRRKKVSKKSLNTNNDQSNTEFELKPDEFPDLKSELKNFKEINEIVPYHYETVSSDATLEMPNKENNIKNKTITKSDSSKSNQLNNSIKQNLVNSNGKKSRQPILIEFANMISALEKGQNDKRKQNVKSGINVNIHENTKNTSKTKSLNNPLDSTPSVKRGKEREKPKQKKPSTLKKIILKEREEKRRNRQLKAEISKLNISSPLSNDSANKSETNFKKLRSTSCNTSTCNEGENDEDNQTDASKKSRKINIDNGCSDTQNTYASEEYETSNHMSPISQGSPLSIGRYTPGMSPYVLQNVEPLSPTKLTAQVKQKIHSKKFREYCNQIVNKEIDSVCMSLLQEIVRFQDRLYHKNPLKAKMRRRYVMGIREVTKHLKLQKIKCIILAPNCEKIQSKGGLDEAINRIIETAIEQNVPFVFALGRKGLGRAVNKLVPISVIGIFDYSGADQYFDKLVQLAENAKLAYNEMVDEYENEERQNLIMLKINQNNMNIVNNNNNNIQPTIPCHLGHSRTPSNGSNISIDPSLINYITHSRTPSGNFTHSRTPSGNFIIQNLANTNNHISGHSRSASGGGGGTLNIDLSSGALLPFHKHFTHSRTPSNCSNISFVSRLSEPISEIGVPINTNTLNYGVSSTILNGNNSNVGSNLTNVSAIQFYSDQVRNEMRDTNDKTNEKNNENEIIDIQESNEVTIENDKNYMNNETSNLALNNLHLSCIHEIDAGNEADIDEDDCDIENSTTQKKIRPINLSNINNTKETNEYQ